MDARHYGDYTFVQYSIVKVNTIRTSSKSERNMVCINRGICVFSGPWRDLSGSEYDVPPQ